MDYGPAGITVIDWLDIHVPTDQSPVEPTLLSSEAIVQPLLVAIVIAAPIAFIVMDGWLQNFAYHIENSWRTFVIASLSAIARAWLTVSYHSIKAALADPVKSLRYE